MRVVHGCNAEALAAARQQVEQLSGQLQRADTTLDEEKAAHRQTHEALQKETIARHTAEQQVADLKQHLAENEAHRASLEEKHRHAREALEHYRQSVKEQREQDQRRHEQQLQQLQAELRQAQQSVIIKQEEVTRLNQEGARLVSDLSHAHKALYDQQTQGRQLEQKIAALQAVEQRATMLEAQAEDKEAQIRALKTQLEVAAAKAEDWSTR